MNHTILIVDDDRMVAASLELLLRRAGYRAESVFRMADALPAIAEHRPALVLLDMNFTIDTSGKDGMGLLKRILAAYPRLPVIQMTGWATVQLAVEGMKAGARDFIAKPWDNRELLNAVAIQVDKLPPGFGHGGAAAGAGEGNEGAMEVDTFSGIIGKAPALLAVLDQARRVAATQASVVITGESGTGKELVAEAIHAASRRAARPFVAVNLGGVPAGLFESELFGHKAGAFTDARADRKGRFELAEGGTLFLDEIGDLDPAAQVKLLRVLQERQYERLGDSKPRTTDVRIISATSRDLHAMVAAGTFREDLLYRINLIHLHLPPLRERPEDIPLLAEHFLASARKRYDRPTLQLGSAAIQWLRHQPFAGNIRQLQNLMERTAILAPANVIQVEDLDRQSRDTGRMAQPALGGITLEEMEIRMIRAALARNGAEITATARELGLTRAALYRRLEKYGITP
ncbi:sigma-54 dependent transcriptional regulator [Neolewinella lacunae]|uniref:Sigma-54-dependent Fis family transcriptional regulator n=1 Tax=Neolewinella lacunae TaxID=1517758 RepID=A0A923PPM9_9BACT|nr:sigma-54 dependent transcriptional regulator [Neolewinella lacunae]MBC6996260.1 sigma-54-dependent Fis family transcriptional regulator [Neolewinella lacunae]MDN3636883.1 sigma-54 dependent transcriptional regulator [Neolewinella lacunae]